MRPMTRLQLLHWMKSFNIFKAKFLNSNLNTHHFNCHFIVDQVRNLNIQATLVIILHIFIILQIAIIQWSLAPIFNDTCVRFDVEIPMTTHSLMSFTVTMQC